MRYRSLDPKLILETAERLEGRVAERFPDAGLRGVAAELVSLSRDLAKAAKALEAPIWWLRGLIIAAFVVGALMFLFVGTILPLGRISGNHDAFQSVQGIEASLNMIILAVLGFLALIRSEERIKRKRVFRQLHGLRSLIHVIDMHQLTKDPAALSPQFQADCPFASPHHQRCRPCPLSRLLLRNAVDHRQDRRAVRAIGE